MFAVAYIVAGSIKQCRSGAVIFNDVGTYGYICGLHPGMKGQIEVVQ